MTKPKTNNVEIKRSGKGWFLTIRDNLTSYTWAVTSEELLETYKIIGDNLLEINNELQKEEVEVEG